METIYRKVADLDLSIRTKNLLINAGIDTLQELTSYTKSDLMKFRNFGRSSLIELEDLMLKNNLSFGTVESIKSDNTQTLENALKQLENLKADKAELLEILNETFLHITPLARFLKEPYQTGLKSRAKSIESLIQKMKKCQENTPR
jgi:hypothetical protein